jgi:broad specificity phosphatase PhoE
MVTTELLLIRHGQSEANAGKSKEPDCALSELGQQQALLLAQRLAHLDLTGFVGVTSPYLRAVQTADCIAQFTGLTFVIDEAIREWGDPVTIKGKQYLRDTIEQLIDRLQGFLDRNRDGKLVVVSHGSPLALLTQLAWGEPPNTAGEFWASVHHCCPRWIKSVPA